jgi:hypothetical protein
MNPVEPVHNGIPLVGLLKTRVQEDLVSPVNHVGANPTIPVMGHEAAILPRRSLLGS